MAIAGQPPDSPALQAALEMLARGQAAEAEVVVTKAAKQAKGRFGSGSHALACAYADMARLHHRTGDYKRAATEFRHAADSPLPSEPHQLADRLAFMFGFVACLDALGKPSEAEKVLRQCVEFARNLHGPDAPGYAIALEPLAAHLLKTGQTAEAAQLADAAYEILWRHGDRAIAPTAAVRAEAFKAVGRLDDPFADFTDLPDDLATEAVAIIIGRTGRNDGVRGRQVFTDLLAFVDRRFGDGHPALADTLAAIVHHEASLGDQGNGKLRAAVARRAVWSFAQSRTGPGLLEGIEVGFENGGTIHLVPRLAREPDPNEAVMLEMVLTQAIDDLYSRPSKIS